MHVVKAGACVRIGDRFVFMFGPHPSGNYLGVVRLGGHREGDETPWECAAREVLEEATMHIRPVRVGTTYVVTDGALTEVDWAPDEVRPLMVTPFGDGVTVLYLAESEETPAPDAETKGLLMPTLAELRHMISSPVTLEQYLNEGGQAMIRVPMERGMRLECSYQLRLLAELLTLR